MNRSPLIIAHRGASEDAPENTLAAFQLGIEQGAHGIELDVHLSADKKLCVLHDHSLQRTTGGEGLVGAKTWAELSNLDTGSWFSEKYAGEKIPCLHEVLPLCPKESLINVEIKNGPVFYQGIAEALATELQPWQRRFQFVVSSFDHYVLEEFYRITPQIRIGVLFEAHLYNPIAYIRSLPYPVYSVHVWHHYVTSEFVDAVHQEGLKILTYTVNEEEDALRVAHLGVDGIITNCPERLLNYLTPS